MSLNLIVRQAVNRPDYRRVVDMSDWHPDEIAHEIKPLWERRLRQLAFTMKRHGCKLTSELANEISKDFKWAVYQCQSPIEVKLLIALLTYFDPEKGLVKISRSYEEFISGSSKRSLLPQCEFKGYRFDFGLCCADGGSPKFYAIEADGKEYHGGARDFKRDVFTRKNGVETFRISGANINRDPFNCVDRLFLMIEKKESL